MYLCPVQSLIKKILHVSLNDNYLTGHDGHQRAKTGKLYAKAKSVAQKAS